MSELQIDRVLMSAKKLGASDIHLVAGLPPMFRIKGDLRRTETEELTSDQVDRVVRMFLDDKQQAELAEAGNVDFSFSGPEETRFRGNAFVTLGNKALALRLFSSTIPTPSEIGLPETLQFLMKRKAGLVLVTGSTGSGKTTSIASLLDYIARLERKRIITVEDPYEITLQNHSSVVSQRYVGKDVRNFPEGLRAMLRQDPDIIMVGELRDAETAETAVRAAATGHLVVTTLHTKTAPESIDYLIGMFQENTQPRIRAMLSTSLLAIICQTLLRTADGEGRMLAYEYVHVQDAVRNMIRKGESHRIVSVIETGRNLGMQRMDDHLFELAKAGKVRVEDAIAAANDPATLNKRLEEKQ